MEARDYNNMAALVASAKGQFCSVTFIKKDGSERLMNIQPAVIKAHIKDPSEVADIDKQRTAARKANNPNLLPVWDVQVQAIRSVNLDTVTLIKVGGQEYRYAD
jgi:hypothetical protein